MFRSRTYGPFRYLTNAALILSEYVFTIDQEVRLFWRKKWTGAVGLYMINRYTTIIYTIYYILIITVPVVSQTAQVSLQRLLLHRY